MHIFKLSNLIWIALFVLLVGVSVNADPKNIEETAKLLPDHLGSFKAITQARPFDDDADFFNGIANVSREYQSTGGERVTALLFKSPSDSAAYARLNSGFMKAFFVSGREQEVRAVNVGTSGYIVPTGLFFYKGPVCVVVNASNRPVKPETLLEFGQQFADTLDKGDGDIPALVKHLPGWESGGIHPDYAVNLAGLIENLPNQPVFDALNFAGGVEAASAHYGALRLVIIEFNTPQLATENDHGITAKIQELGTQGQPAPAYRRVGNYAVFVFDAPTQEAANQLIDQVKYQQVVQWLGENPFSYEKATREFTETTLGVLVAVVKTSGLALLSCLAVGGFFGALLFRFRRAQQRATDAYSDADAMIRLNLDELTPESDPARLLGRGE